MNSLKNDFPNTPLKNIDRLLTEMTSTVFGITFQNDLVSFNNMKYHPVSLSRSIYYRKDTWVEFLKKNKCAAVDRFWGHGKRMQVTKHNFRKSFESYMCRLNHGLTWYKAKVNFREDPVQFGAYDLLTFDHNFFVIYGENHEIVYHR